METTKSNRWLRVLLVLGWTALCGLTWLMWMTGVFSSEAASDPAVSQDVLMAAQACSCAVGTGCAGSVWFCGLLVSAVIYALIRR